MRGGGGEGGKKGQNIVNIDFGSCDLKKTESKITEVCDLLAEVTTIFAQNVLG